MVDVSLEFQERTMRFDGANADLSLNMAVASDRKLKKDEAILRNPYSGRHAREVSSCIQ